MIWKTAWIPLMLLTPAVVVAQVTAPDWVHIEVRHFDRSGTTVRLNLPAQVVVRSFPLLPDLGCASFSALAGESRLSGRDLVAIASRLAEVGSGERVEHDTGEYLVVATANGEDVTLRVREKSSGDPIDVSMSAAVMRALSGGERRGLDLGAAVGYLAARGGGEVALIDTEDARIRIWVDRIARSREE